MNDRERRDFEAGLAADVDAWLRGDPTRRSFIKKFGQLTGMLAISGSIIPATAQFALAQAKLDLADPSTPLGKAQAAAMKASTDGPADGSAYRAVQAAKQYSGVTLNMTYEAGLQALDPRNYLRPCVGKPDRHQVQCGRTLASRPVFEAGGRAHRQFRCL
ncbi:hypothetical protein [Aestuariivirga sp.]|uniref:hypothetical protein n=1 Tax=Aestuariivirga sp. TaxID=2650926 RepID=UPI0039E29894